MTTMNTKKTKTGDISVWIHGAEMRGDSWREMLVLEVGEGFRTVAKARRWASAAMKRHPGASHYRIAPAY